jgi:hypothetical protein
MLNKVIWLCAAMAVIVAGALSPPMMSMAQAHERAEGALFNRDRGYNYSGPYWAQKPPPNRSARNPAAYHGYFTLPEFDPEYHGSNGG